MNGIIERIDIWGVNSIYSNKGRSGFLRSIRNKLAVFVLIVIAAAVISAAWFGPARVWAGLQNALGRGSDPEQVEMTAGAVGEEEQENNAIGNNRSRIDLDNGRIEITGYMIMSDSACLAISLEQVAAFRLFPGFEGDSASEEMIKQLDERLKQIYLVDQEGREYRYAGGNYISEHFSSSGCATGAAWSSLILIEIPLFSEEAETLTLVVPLSDVEELTKDIPRTFLEEIGECNLPGLTITW